ncbi:MAG: hypothetical protein J5495_06030 [Bacteroidales bacterium]|nr:hypothetical protein [Bacteroidales bacterium]
MKRFILVIVALLMVSGGLFAQHRYDRGPRDFNRTRVHGYYSHTPRVHGGIYIGNGYDYGYDYTFANELYAMYGSEYRRAKVARNSGILLTTVVAPLSLALACQGAYVEDPSATTLGVIGTIGGLGAGIPLWVSGQRRLDWMMDDFVSRYGGARPSLRIGTGRNGFGFSLNF